jgi:hypothetical protein
MMKRKICQFNGRSKYWNILEEALFFASKRFRGYKRKKFRSVMGVMVLTSWSCFCVFAKGENPLDIDFERAKN